MPILLLKNLKKICTIFSTSVEIISCPWNKVMELRVNTYEYKELFEHILLSKNYVSFSNQKPYSCGNSFCIIPFVFPLIIASIFQDMKKSAGLSFLISK